jgi:hypothetical protein
MPNIGFLDTESNFRVTSVKDFQLSNMWAINFSDMPLDFDFYVTDTNIPLQKISVDKLGFDLIVPGEKEELGSYEITFLETIDFQGYKYFNKWLNSIYDFKKRAYKKGFHALKKSAKLKFLSLRNIGLGGGVGNAVTSLTNRLLPPISLPSLPQIGGLQIPGGNILGALAGAATAGVGISIPNMYFTLSGIMITGIEDIDMNNDSGDPLTLKVSMEIQSIVSESGTGLAGGVDELQNQVSGLRNSIISNPEAALRGIIGV